MDITQALPIVACAVSFIVAGGYSAWIMRQNPGTSAMQEISEAVRVGAAAFLRREMKIIIPIAIGLAVVIGFFIGISNGIAFAVGAALSAVAGIISLKITVKCSSAFHCKSDIQGTGTHVCTSISRWRHGGIGSSSYGTTCNSSFVLCIS